jgi:hypothetical protein
MGSLNEHPCKRSAECFRGTEQSKVVTLIETTLRERATSKMEFKGQRSHWKVGVDAPWRVVALLVRALC